MSFIAPYAFEGPASTGVIRQQPEDFIVEEILRFEPSGEGEHVFLLIRKRGENTEYVARAIAEFAAVPRGAVNYAGMKDRHALTTQWFGVHMPGKREVEWRGLESGSVSVLQCVRHNRKLRTGALKGNRFTITVRELAGDRNILVNRLARIKAEGFPNYFGSQRFGREGNNVSKAQAFFSGELKIRDRKLKGIYLSSARSEIFNRVLARRVNEGIWNRPVEGDVFMFEGSHGFFRSELNEDIFIRLANLEIHPSGPLWGTGEPPTTGKALTLEKEAAAELDELCEGLERLGVEAGRRPLRVSVPDLTWEFIGADELRLSFSLPAGAYATVAVREAVAVDGELD